MKLRRTIPALFALLGACAAPAPQPPAMPEAARPALWKVADEDTTVYLFGTIHILPDGYRWETPAIGQAVARSDDLVIETLVPDQAELARVMGELGTSPGLPPLLDRVPAEKRPRLRELIDRTKVPMRSFDAMETWAAAIVLVAVTLPDLGLKGGSGVEGHLQALFTEAKKPISGLEKPSEQLGYMDRLAEVDQREFLSALLEEGEAMQTEFDTMLAAWARGDERAIAASFDDELEVTSGVRDALLVQRNAAWVRWIEARMARPGTTLVAVGAGHLAGADSVNAMLQKRGLKVERIQ